MGVESLITLSQLLMQVIPLSWAAAVSPVSLSIFLFMISFTDNRRLAGFSFFFGAIILLLIVVSIGIILGQSLIVTNSQNTIKDGIDLFLGIILVLLGIRSIFKENHENSFFKFLQVDKNVSTISKFGRYFIIGFFTFLINFSTSIFVLGAGREIGLADVGLIPTLVSVFVLIIITMILLEIPFLLFLLKPSTAERIMKPLENWVNKNGNYIISAFLLVIGIVITYKAAVGLKLF